MHAVGLMMLGHGAGGGVTAHDLRLAAEVALGAGLAVALVEQPYRVAGRRAPAPPAHVDAPWRAVAQHLHGADLGDLPLIVGGRSFGGRVACRTARGRRGVRECCAWRFPCIHWGAPRSPGSPNSRR